MRILLTIILFFGFFCASNASAEDWRWARGNSKCAEGWAVATDPSGNVFAAGSYPSLIISKYDPVGNMLWTNQIDSAVLINICSDQFGNVIVFGIITANVQIGAFMLTRPANSSPYFLAKFAPSGSVIWALSAGNVIGGFGRTITTDIAGNIFITANFEATVETIGPYTFTNISPPYSDILIVKYDGSGNLIWAKSIGGQLSDFVSGICATDAGDIYITGTFFSSSITIGSSTIFNSGTTAIFIARFNSAGSPAWAAASSGQLNFRPTAIASDKDDDIYITGSIADDKISFCGTTVYNAYWPNTSAYLIKLDKSSNCRWTKIIGDPDTSSVVSYSVATSCGYVWVSGAFQNSFLIDGHLTRRPPSSEDAAFIAGFTAEGTFDEASALTSGGDDDNNVACDIFGNVFLCGDYFRNLVIANDTLPPPPEIEAMFVAEYPFKGADPAQFAHLGNVVCLNSNNLLTAHPGYADYFWNDGIIGRSRPIKDTGIFLVYGVNKCESSLIDTFKVIPACDCNKALFMPNAFTPNGDGQDDTFYPRSGLGIDKIRSFRVYNRWGELLFGRENILPNDASNAWDGTYKGEKPLPDVFVWVVDAVCENGTVINKKGSVTIIR
jgi:gliding motility-associated-like protein